MTITNISKPSPSVLNADKVSVGQTWETWDVAWDDEMRTWDELGTLVTNKNRPSPGETCLLMEDGFKLLLEDGGCIMLTTDGGITNEPKP